MVSTGWNSSFSYFSENEVINLRNTSEYCNELPNFPVSTSRADGGIVDKVLIICSSWGVSKTDCFKFDNINGQWTLLATIEPRRYKKQANNA